LGDPGREGDLDPFRVINWQAVLGLEDGYRLGPQIIFR
jgi:hypothetical protein